MFFEIRGLRRFAQANRRLSGFSHRFGKLTRHLDHRESLFQRIVRPICRIYEARERGSMVAPTRWLASISFGLERWRHTLLQLPEII
jgi:nitrate reductase assembly molybdenum cofactor insertion protein NarJ